MIEFIFFGILIFIMYLGSFPEVKLKNQNKPPKLLNSDGYDFKEYFSKLNEEIEKIIEEYNKKISVIKSEIELLPSDDEFIEFKKLKEKTLREMENKRDIYIIGNLTKIRKKFPTFIVVKNHYYPVRSKDIIQYYTELSKKNFGNSNITFINEDRFTYIVNEFYDIFYFELKYFKHFLKVINVKTEISFSVEIKNDVITIKNLGE